MATTTFEIQVQDDHVEKVARTNKPMLALSELIWNSLDADAMRVTITLETDALNGLSAIEVDDNGHGIPRSDIETLFKKLGGSWKKSRRYTNERQRLLHGKEGKGRLRAFSLGRVVDWTIRYKEDGQLLTYPVRMVKEKPRHGEIDDPTLSPKSNSTGVTVRITELLSNFRSLSKEDAPADLAAIFALYLRQHPGIEISINGALLDPASVVDLSKEYLLPEIKSTSGKTYPAALEVVEWKVRTPRKLFLCNADGFPIDEQAPGVTAPSFEFSAYLKCDYFTELQDTNSIDLAGMDPQVPGVLAAARAALRDHFRKRSAERATGLVAEWREQKVYPFEEAPKDAIEEAERQVFDLVALSINTYLPDFAETDLKTKRLQLRLLRQAIERGADDLNTILIEVLDLPAERRKELAALLSRTTLTSVITASRIIADRLTFLKGLETLVFDDEFKDRVLERTQLHRIVAENSWLFGEQYHLSVDDQSLTEVLKKHIELQHREVQIDEPVRRADGRRGIVDLMYSRNTSIAGSAEREHLVVELKRPKIPIDTDATNQVESYAFAVADDERFRDVNVRWVFWAISTDIDANVRRKTKQRDRQPGILHQDDAQRITIWVKTWGQIINDARVRLQFMADKLAIAPDRDQSLAYLKATYPKYLAELFSEGAADES
jgi:hypothetical protein